MRGQHEGDGEGEKKGGEEKGQESEDMPRQKLLLRQVGEFSGWIRLAGSKRQLVCPCLEMSRMRARGELLLEPHYLGNMWAPVHRNTFFFILGPVKYLVQVQETCCTQYQHTAAVRVLDKHYNLKVRVVLESHIRVFVFLSLAKETVLLSLVITCILYSLLKTANSFYPRMPYKRIHRVNSRQRLGGHL